MTDELKQRLQETLIALNALHQQLATASIFQKADLAEKAAVLQLKFNNIVAEALWK